MPKTTDKRRHRFISLLVFWGKHSWQMLSIEEGYYNKNGRAISDPAVHD